MGSTPGRVAIIWLVPGWVTVCAQVNHLSISSTTQVNSAFHPSGVGKSSTDLYGWGYGGARSPV